MLDLASFSSALTSVKVATEMARLIKDSGPTLADAERKLKLAEMVGALADTKMALSDLKEEIESRDAQIKTLKDALQRKGQLKHTGAFYFEAGDPTPFCPRCWESEAKSIHVSPEEWQHEKGFYVQVCPQCKSEYKTRDGNMGALLI